MYFRQHKACPIRHSCPNPTTYLHFLVIVDVQEGLQELDYLQSDKQADGHQIGVQDPEGNQQDDGVHKAVAVVALHSSYQAGALQGTCKNH